MPTIFHCSLYSNKTLYLAALVKLQLSTTFCGCMPRPPPQERAHNLPPAHPDTRAARHDIGDDVYTRALGKALLELGGYGALATSAICLALRPLLAVVPSTPTTTSLQMGSPRLRHPFPKPSPTPQSTSISSRPHTQTLALPVMKPLSTKRRARLARRCSISAVAKIALPAGNFAGTFRAGKMVRDAERRARRAGLRTEVRRWRWWSSTRRERRESGGTRADASASRRRPALTRMLQ